jgi:hypothetical protein
LSETIIDGKGMEFVGEFAPAEVNPLGPMYRKAYELGFMTAWSVGFIPQETERSEDGGPVRHTKSELLEISAVAVPSNRDSITNALEGDDLMAREFAGAVQRSFGSAQGDDVEVDPELLVKQLEVMSDAVKQWLGFAQDNTDAKRAAVTAMAAVLSPENKDGEADKVAAHATLSEVYKTLELTIPTIDVKSFEEFIGEHPLELIDTQVEAAFDDGFVTAKESCSNCKPPEDEKDGPGDCPPGTTWCPETQACEQDMEEDGDEQKADDDEHPDENADEQCPDGFVWSEEAGECVPDTEAPQMEDAKSAFHLTIDTSQAREAAALVGAQADKLERAALQLQAATAAAAPLLERMTELVGQLERAAEKAAHAAPPTTEHTTPSPKYGRASSGVGMYDEALGDELAGRLETLAARAAQNGKPA